MPFGDLGALAQWNPATNSPKLKSGVGQEGMIYRCSVSGTQTLDDNSEWNQNDLVAYSALMGKWFRLGPVNIPTDTEVALGQDNQKVITSKKLAAAMAAWGFVNVKTYGATGDGVTDDTAACQAAIDAAAGKVLLWPAGTYMVTQLTARASSKWWGMGLAASVISRKGTAAQDLVVCQSIGWTSFNDLTFRGGDVPVSPAYSNVAMNLCTHCQFTDCYFDQFDKLGIGCQGCFNIDVENCWFVKTAMSHTGVNEGFLSGVASGPSSNCTVRNSFFYNCGSIFQGSFPVFEYNYVNNWGYGAGCSTGTASGDWYARISFNYMSSAAGQDSDNLTLKGIENWSAFATIIGNICVGCSGPGIYCGGPYSSVTGNSCVNNNSFGEANSGGIVIAYSSPTNSGHHVTVSGNTCLDTGTGTQYYGVVVSALCDYVTVSGNNLRGNVTAPFEIQGGTNSTIYWDGFANGVADSTAWGVVGNGSTDCAAWINSAIAFVAAQGGGIVNLPAGTIVVGSTIDNKYSNVLVKGAGRRGGYVAYPITVGAGTIIKPTFAGTVCKHRSVYGIHNPKTTGGGFWDMDIIDNNVATRLLEIDTVFFTKYRVFLDGSQGTESLKFVCGQTGVDLTDACDNQHIEGDFIISMLGSAHARATDAVVLDGALNANTSMNRLRIVAWHKDGHVLRGVSGDSNEIFVIGFGTGGTGKVVYAQGPTATRLVGFSTNDLWVSGAGGAYLQGTDTAGVTAGITNRIWWLDDGNGTPAPTAGTGSFWHYRATLYDVDHNQAVNRLIGVDVDSHTAGQVAKFTTETARLYNSLGDFLRLDNEIGHEWGFTIDGTNGNFRLVRFAGTGVVNLGNGAGCQLWAPGFNGTASTAKPTVTGDKDGNAALASLLSALATMGLITDSTT